MAHVERGDSMKKTMFLIIIIIPLLFCSCSKKIPNAHVETMDYSVDNLQSNQAEELPEDFTIDKIKSALLEYINYRLWLYPAKIPDNASDKNFDDYIDKPIDVEIRIYNNSSGKSVYAHTSIGQWLAVFKSNNGFVYCDGQTSKGEYGWPRDTENYRILKKYSVVIPQPHKPNYGTSQHKDKMIAALESTIKTACDDFYKGADKYYDEWVNVEVYIADFYEYEDAAYAWLCRQDGAITNFPVAFEEKNGEIKVQTITGFTMISKNEFNEFGRFLFERDISDAVKHFKCNIREK
jgi:hypothetical protein